MRMIEGCDRRSSGRAVRDVLSPLSRRNDDLFVPERCDRPDGGRTGAIEHRKATSANTLGFGAIGSVTSSGFDAGSSQTEQQKMKAGVDRQSARGRSMPSRYLSRAQAASANRGSPRTGVTFTASFNPRRSSSGDVEQALEDGSRNPAGFRMRAARRNSRQRDTISTALDRKIEPSQPRNRVDRYPHRLIGNPAGPFAGSQDRSVHRLDHGPPVRRFEPDQGPCHVIEKTRAIANPNPAPTAEMQPAGLTSSQTGKERATVLPSINATNS